MLRALIPQVVRDLRVRWVRRRLKWAEAEAYRLTEARVAGGPFVGMRYVADTGGIPVAPRLMGTYEMELEGLIVRLLRSRYKRLVNVGAGDGFYAVGFLMRNPELGAVAFETEAHRRSIIADLAALNGVVDRLTIHGACTHAALSAAVSAAVRTLVFCDIEGAEKQLLDPGKVRLLRFADILAEVHDFVDPEITQVLRQRFEVTHTIHTIESRDRVVSDLPVPWRHKRLLPLLSERRPCPLEWLWMEANSPPDTPFPLLSPTPGAGRSRGRYEPRGAPGPRSR